MKVIILLLMISFSLASINFETGVQHSKIVNGDAGIELYAKGSTRITNYIPFVFQEEILRKLYYGVYLGAGVSQQYTSPRDSQFAYNHYGHRLDFSLGLVIDNVEAIYTHSIRNKYSGANPDVLYWNNGDVDSITLRWKGEL